MSRRQRFSGGGAGLCLVALLGVPLVASSMQPPAAADGPPAAHVPLADAEARIDPASGHGAPLPPPPGLPEAVPTEASVILLVDLDPNGDVTNVAIERSSRIRQYDRAAIAYAQTLRYQPQVLHGMPVASRLRMQVDYSAAAAAAD